MDRRIDHHYGKQDVKDQIDDHHGLLLKGVMS